MPSSARLFGFDMGAFTASEVATGTPPVYDALGLFQNVEVQFDQELAENRAVKDQWTDPVTKISSWRMPVTVAVEGGTGGASAPNGYNFATLIGKKCAAKVASAGSGTIGYSGNALLTNYRHPFNDGGQTQSWDFVGKGALAITNAAP